MACHDLTFPVLMKHFQFPLLVGAFSWHLLATEAEFLVNRAGCDGVHILVGGSLNNPQRGRHKKLSDGNECSVENEKTVI